MNLALVAALALGASTMPQPWGDLLNRDHILVLGTPGCGKTPFAAELVEGGPLARRFGFTRAARRVVYFSSARGSWAEHGDRIAAADLEEPGIMAGVTLRLVVVPDEASLLSDFAHTVDACRAAAPYGGLVLLVDEVGDLTDAGGSDILRGLHRNGHHAGVATVFASPAWTDIPARCRSTRSRVYSFRQLADADVKTMNAELGRVVPDFGELAARWTYPAPPVAWVSPTLH